MLRSMLKIYRLQSSKSKVENQLRQEKVENRAHQAQIKKLQTNLLLAEKQVDKGASTQRLLNKNKITFSC